MRTRRIFLFSLSALFIGVLSGGCADMDVDPSLLEAPRILAVQLSPRTLTPGETHTLMALTHDLTEVTWTGCLTPFIPDQDVTCPVPIPGDLLGQAGPGLAVSFPLPAELPVTDLWVKVTGADGTVLPVVLQVGGASGPENPSVTQVNDAEGVAITQVTRGSSVEVWPVLVDPLATNRLTVSFFTTAGSFASHRTIDGAPSMFEAPDEVGPLRWIINVRDGDAGIGWGEFTVEVVE